MSSKRPISILFHGSPSENNAVVTPHTCWRQQLRLLLVSRERSAAKLQL
jgi:hypothetical protein